MQNISEEGLNLIRKYEGFSARPYLCPAAVWTQGYGHTRGVTQFSEPVDEAQATEWLREDVETAERSVRRLIVSPLSQGQFDALVSFTFNLGGGALQRSTLRRKVNAGEHDAVPAELMKWCRAGGKVMKGLLNRRRAEAALYDSATPQGMAYEVPHPDSAYLRRGLSALLSSRG